MKNFLVILCLAIAAAVGMALIVNAAVTVSKEEDKYYCDEVPAEVLGRVK